MKFGDVFWKRTPWHRRLPPRQRLRHTGIMVRIRDIIPIVGRTIQMSEIWSFTQHLYIAVPTYSNFVLLWRNTGKANGWFASPWLRRRDVSIKLYINIFFFKRPFMMFLYYTHEAIQPIGGWTLQCRFETVVLHSGLWTSFSIPWAWGDISYIFS